MNCGYAGEDANMGGGGMIAAEPFLAPGGGGQSKWNVERMIGALIKEISTSVSGCSGSFAGVSFMNFAPVTWSRPVFLPGFNKVWVQFAVCITSKLFSIFKI